MGLVKFALSALALLASVSCSANFGQEIELSDDPYLLPPPPMPAPKNEDEQQNRQDKVLRHLFELTERLLIPPGKEAKLQGRGTWPKIMEQVVLDGACTSKRGRLSFLKKSKGLGWDIPSQVGISVFGQQLCVSERTMNPKPDENVLLGKPPEGRTAQARLNRYGGIKRIWNRIIVTSESEDSAIDELLEGIERDNFTRVTDGYFAGNDTCMLFIAKNEAGQLYQSGQIYRYRGDAFTGDIYGSDQNRDYVNCRARGVLYAAGFEGAAFVDDKLLLRSKEFDARFASHLLVGSVKPRPSDNVPGEYVLRPDTLHAVGLLFWYIDNQFDPDENKHFSFIDRDASFRRGELVAELERQSDFKPPRPSYVPDDPLYPILTIRESSAARLSLLFHEHVLGPRRTAPKAFSPPSVRETN